MSLSLLLASSHVCSRRWEPGQSSSRVFSARTAEAAGETVEHIRLGYRTERHGDACAALYIEKFTGVEFVWSTDGEHPRDGLQVRRNCWPHLASARFRYAGHI